MIKKIYLTLLLSLFLINNSHSKENFFEEAKKLFNDKKYKESKFLFQRNIIFNPKNAYSYLYLAKIFKENDNQEEEEINLNNVLLINPENDEAIYLLTLLKIKQSDYKKAEDLVDKFSLICKSFCSKRTEMKDKLKKLSPDNAAIKN